MKIRCIIGIVIFCFLGLACCQVLNTTSESNQKRFAELRLGLDGKTQILICTKVWRGFFTMHGFGGYQYVVFYWATLKGDGPDYLNPSLRENSPYPSKIYTGTITVKRNDKQVVINLQQVPSKSEDARQIIPSPANGTYQIRDINHDSFITPE